MQRPFPGAWSEEALLEAQKLRGAAASKISPLDLRLQMLDGGAERFEIGVNGERFPVSFQGARLVAVRHIDVAEPGERREMARLAREGLVQVRDRAHRIVQKIEGRGAPVPGLGPSGLQRDHTVKQ